MQHDAVGDDPGRRLRFDAGAGTADRKPADVPELHPGPVQLLPRLLCSTGNEIMSRTTHTHTHTHTNTHTYVRARHTHTHTHIHSSRYRLLSLINILEDRFE